MVGLLVLANKNSTNPNTIITMAAIIIKPSTEVQLNAELVEVAPVLVVLTR